MPHGHFRYIVRLLPKCTPSTHGGAGSCEFPRGKPNVHPRPSRLESSPSPYLVNTMVADFNKLWKRVHTATDEAESVRALAKILSSKDGRAFILDLEPPDAELCIEILDHVSPNPPSTVLGGLTIQ